MTRLPLPLALFFFLSGTLNKGKCGIPYERDSIFRDPRFDFLDTARESSKPYPRELIGAAPKMLTELRRLLKRHGEQETANVIATATKRRDRSQP